MALAQARLPSGGTLLAPALASSGSLTRLKLTRPLKIKFPFNQNKSLIVVHKPAISSLPFDPFIFLLSSPFIPIMDLFTRPIVNMEP
jgi:hypothetical protein